MTQQPQLGTLGPESGARGVVLFLHGGQAASTATARRGAAWARMVPFWLGVAYGPGNREVAAWLLRYRVRGWNEPAMDPLLDARWALGEARRRHPGAPIVLVGHSMGGRVALRLTAEPDVSGVCVLAPWIEPGEPWQPPTCPVLIAHGDEDRITDPGASAAYAARIGASFVPVPGEKHALLHRPIFWQRLVTGFVSTTLGAASHVR